ncbi:diguanylate cyclase [Nitrincola sp. A-D6]|uniref:GGDEF domain-containing protein n=1 Tax=Nitrincola sp. A-D6 TaxID=1545442 RepID=UPI00051FAF5E|nr:sensor domain-containing diguanylate cyclase [Nitrincola sp. A-D6]KGK42579.1 diguanylate cyclase [Nitrincola sp. A-D6]
MPKQQDDLIQDDSFYKALLESTKAIPWKIDWETLTFAYIGPQIEELLGWKRDSWAGINDWAERMHPDDRERVVNFCVAQSKAGADHEADYRALTADGEYIWIRDVVHIVRNSEGQVESLVGFMFDITERKKNEEELLRLQHELQELSFKDALTGVANRRMFDERLEAEWMHAQRHQQPLSLIMIDIDLFKQYNDMYGHVQGDSCLKQVAQTLNSAVLRSGDFFARFGGEEFVLILPQTEIDAAVKVAERCRKLIFKQQIPHPASDVSSVLTISIGVGTHTPARQDQASDFIEAVDRRLYASKQQGRNCIVR